MNINIFEGARRIAKIITAIILLCTVGYVVQNPKEIGESSMYLVGGLALFWAFVWCVGWVMRGFLGIPSGEDKRP